MSDVFTVIGLSDSRSPALCPEAMRAVVSSKVFAGGERHREIVRYLLPQDSRWITIAPPLSDVMRELLDEDAPIVVFTSGDPLFYGFGATLQKRFPEASYRYFPAFSSLQLLAHRLRQPYQAMRNASLTGRGWQELDRLLIERCPLIGVLCDRKKTPAVIAERLLEYNYSGYSIAVGEALGGPRERVRLLCPEEAAGSDFHEPSCVILRSGAPGERRFGIADHLFEGLPGRPDMITKMPVRLATLSRLDLVNSRTFWDIGFCTASVSIEARLQFPWLDITAFEKRPECEGIFERNTRSFGAPGIRVVMGDVLQQSPREFTGGVGTVDAVFIGGHGGCLDDVFAFAAERLAPGGRIAVNAVRRETLAGFHRCAGRHSLCLLEDLCLTPSGHNAITIATAVK